MRDATSRVLIKFNNVCLVCILAKNNFIRLFDVCAFKLPLFGLSKNLCNSTSILNVCAACASVNLRRKAHLTRHCPMKCFLWAKTNFLASNFCWLKGEMDQFPLQMCVNKFWLGRIVKFCSSQRKPHKKDFICGWNEKTQATCVVREYFQKKRLSYVFQTG